ncbi:MAG: 4Fe-4S dicluster domain-containing protein [Ruminococcaceae bacterium]|nr:4Fe-4S dicluster domain-containing protein [Oscillospiraceae bacterium]
MPQLPEKACSGCHACSHVCPNSCIKLVANEAGFLYPVIDLAACSDCGLCESVCQVIHPLTRKETPTAYACRNLDEATREASSSGGIFSLLAEEIIKQSGVVFGAAFDDKFNVRHIVIENKEELYKLRGSKYVQSTIGDAYRRTESFLEDGRPVLFTGTPCQINGLLHCLKKEYPHLYTQDIICHGVPSPNVWHTYINYLQSLFGADIQNFSFRSKKSGWTGYSVYASFSNGEIYSKKFTEDSFMQAFLHNLCLRPSCYQCSSKGIERNSDITLADFWGVERVAPDQFDNKGTSLVLIHSEKGRRLMQLCSASLTCREVSVDAAVAYNPSVHISSPTQKNRSGFMHDISVVNSNFAAVVKRYTKVPLWKRVVIRGITFAKCILRKKAERNQT